VRLLLPLPFAYVMLVGLGVTMGGLKPGYLARAKTHPSSWKPPCYATAITLSPGA
jgi:hypothetical protein